MSRIGTRKVKETQKIVLKSRFLEKRPKIFLTRYARQKNIQAYISRKLFIKFANENLNYNKKVPGDVNKADPEDGADVVVDDDDVVFGCQGLGMGLEFSPVCGGCPEVASFPLPVLAFPPAPKA